MSAQHDELVRAALVRAVGRGAQVLLVGEDAVLGALLEQAGSRVVDAAASAPTHVVFARPFEVQTVASELAAWAGRQPGATFVFFAWNAASASSLLLWLEGARPPAGMSASEVGEALSAAGLAVKAASREAWQAPVALAEPTQQSLRALFAQLNPETESVGTTYTVERGARLDEPAREAGLLSVVMRNHSVERLGLIDDAIFSLACQTWRPLEIVLVTQSTAADAVSKLEALLERHRGVGGYRSRVISVPSQEDLRSKLVNVGVAAARGQYLAFLDDDDVVYPHHYTRLISALRGAGNAWAFARTRRARFRTGGDGELYCYQKDYFPQSERFELGELLHDNYVPCHSYVLDRARLGSFKIEFEESLGRGEDYILLLRLLAAFRPLSMGENASCEYRMRDGASNTVIHDAMADELREQREREWQAAFVRKNQLRDGLPLLITQGEFDRACSRANRVEYRAPEELRYRLADAINTRVKQWLPWVHGALRSAAGRDEDEEG